MEFPFRKAISLVPVAALALLAFLPFRGLLGGEFLYDDLHVIVGNSQLQAVSTLGDCFRFVLKPSKPVTNFLLAFGHWAGNGSIVAHRGISLLTHVLVTLLLFLVLRMKYWPRGPTAFWIAALFAVHPIHTESIGIVLFRMEMLGTLFTLLGALAAIRGNVPAVILCGGFATMSKETFGLIFPLAVTLLAWPVRRRLLVSLAVGQVLWGAVMLWLLSRDSATRFPYHQVIGGEALSPLTHLHLSARAVIEGMGKLASGHGLTVIRLRDRLGPGAGMGIVGALGVLGIAVGLVAWLFAKPGWRRQWGGVLAAGVGIYLLIPNINIGSEHYWYFPAMAVCTLLVGGLANLLPRFTDRPALMMWAVVGGVAIALSTSTLKRVGEMRSRLEFYAAELEKHPENAGVWNDVALSLMEVPGRENALKARPFIDKAKELDPRSPNVRTAELLYDLHTQQD